MELDGLKQVLEHLEGHGLRLQVLPLIDISKSVVTCVISSVKSIISSMFGMCLRILKKVFKVVQTKAFWGAEAMDKSHT